MDICILMGKDVDSLGVIGAGRIGEGQGTK